MKTAQSPKTGISLLHRHLPPAMAAVAITVIAGAELMAPDPLALPMISLLALGIAAAVALLAWATGARRDGDAITAWDVAGAFTLIGCAAAMLTQNEYALEYFIASKTK
jgi:hypothetical protein